MIEYDEYPWAIYSPETRNYLGFFQSMEEALDEFFQYYIYAPEDDMTALQIVRNEENMPLEIYTFNVSSGQMEKRNDAS